MYFLLFLLDFAIPHFNFLKINYKQKSPKGKSKTFMKRPLVCLKNYTHQSTPSPKLFPFFSLEDSYKSIAFCTIKVENIIMGSQCSNDKQKCPQHTDQNIQFICLHPRCIEPLCGACLQKHRVAHSQIGSPPQIEKLNDIQNQLLSSMEAQANIYQAFSEHTDSVKQISVPDIIKQFTRQYFLRRRSAIALKKLSLNETLSYIEMNTVLKQDNQAQLRIRQFFKKNLKLNNGVLQTDYSHLY